MSQRGSQTHGAGPKQDGEHTGTATELLPIILLRDTGMVMSDLLILKRVGNLDFIYAIKELCF